MNLYLFQYLSMNLSISMGGAEKERGKQGKEEREEGREKENDYSCLSLEILY